MPASFVNSSLLSMAKPFQFVASLPPVEEKIPKNPGKSRKKKIFPTYYRCLVVSCCKSMKALLFLFVVDPMKACRVCDWDDCIFAM